MSILDRYSDSPILLLSNGMYFKSTTATQIAKNSNLRIRISLDGHTSEEHDRVRGPGSFDKVVSGIRNLQDVGFDNIALSVTIHRSTVASIPRILDLAKALRVQSVKIEPVAKSGRAKTHFGPAPSIEPDAETESFRSYMKTLLDLKDWTVRKIEESVFDTVTIYSNGDVYPFTYYNEIDRQSGLVGNINETDILELIDSQAWHDSVLTKILQFSLGPNRSMGAFIFTPKERMSP